MKVWIVVYMDSNFDVNVEGCYRSFADAEDKAKEMWESCYNNVGEDKIIKDGTYFEIDDSTCTAYGEIETEYTFASVSVLEREVE